MRKLMHRPTRRMICRRARLRACVAATGSITLSFLLLMLPQAGAAQTGARADRSIALTFDDLPTTSGSCDSSHVERVTEKLTAVLESHSLPSAGLATPGRACLSAGTIARTLARWQATGAIIGNHTATHLDINTTALDAYFADIARAQQLIEGAVRTTERWFRPPYLHTGDALQKKKALESYLAANEYRMLPVTIDNQEWVYAAVYEDASSRGDDPLARRVVDAYVQHIDESVDYYERLSRTVFAREIPQILLLHANLLNAEHLGRLVTMLVDRGYRFVSVREALSDPAYRRQDTYVGPRGLSWLQRWALADGVAVTEEPREAAWVADAFRSAQRR